MSQDINTYVRDNEVDALMVLFEQMETYGYEHGWDKISWHSRRVLGSLITRLVTILEEDDDANVSS